MWGLQRSQQMVLLTPSEASSERLSPRSLHIAEQDILSIYCTALTPLDFQCLYTNYLIFENKIKYFYQLLQIFAQNNYLQ